MSERYNRVYEASDKKALISRCLGQLQAYIPSAKLAVTSPSPEDEGVDFRLKVGRGGAIPGVLKAQSYLSREQVNHIILKAFEVGRRFLGELIVFAQWIPDSWADAFRKARSVEYVRINYVDSLGNAFVHLNDPPVLIDIRGRRPEKPTPADPGRLIEPSGLKVIHTLLTQEGAVGMPFRTLADRSGVSLGTVGIVMRELRRAGYLVPISKDRWKLDRRPALIEHFVRGYGLKLRPSVLLGQFRHTEDDPEKLADWIGLKYGRGNPSGEKYGGVLTGALGEQRLAGHLHADSLVLFVKPWAREAILKEEPMRPDAVSGNVTLLHWFAPAVLDSGRQIHDLPWATDLLIYAELLHDGRPREIEAADLLRKRRLEISHP